jgi:hypothetical protein
VEEAGTEAELSLAHAVDNILDIQFLHGYNQPTLLSLRGGKLYVLSLLVDSLRAVKGFHLDKAVRK